MPGKLRLNGVGLLQASANVHRRMWLAGGIVTHLVTQPGPAHPSVARRKLSAVIEVATAAAGPIGLGGNFGLVDARAYTDDHQQAEDADRGDDPADESAIERCALAPPGEPSQDGQRETPNLGELCKPPQALMLNPAAERDRGADNPGGDDERGETAYEGDR